MHPKAMKSVNASKLRKGAWSSDEDTLLRKCIHAYGEGKWHLVPQRAGLNRCRKSCRLRWLNYLRPTLRRGDFSADEVDLMMRLHRLLGNRWSLIAGRLPGRTGNDVKNFWNTNIQKKLTLARKEKEVVIREEPPHVVVKPLPRNLSKHTRISCRKDMHSYPAGEMVCNNMISKSNHINMLLDKPPTPPPDQNGIDWWKNLFAEVGTHGQEKGLSEGLLLASPSGSQNMDAERGLFWEHHEFPTPVIEATRLLEEDGRSSWSDFWDLLDSDLIN